MKGWIKLTLDEDRGDFQIWLRTVQILDVAPLRDKAGSHVGLANGIAHHVKEEPGAILDAIARAEADETIF